MEVLRRDVEGLGRQVSKPHWHTCSEPVAEICKVVQLRRDFAIAQDPTAEAHWPYNVNSATTQMQRLQ